MQTNKTGFTLIELLVVVLIIGILAAVALPQYQKAVEKSRITEVLINSKTIKNSMDLLLLETGGFPTKKIQLNEIDTAGALSGGQFDKWNNYITKNFGYSCICIDEYCQCEIDPLVDENLPIFLLTKQDIKGPWLNECVTNLRDKTRAICKSLENQGWTYADREI